MSVDTQAIKTLSIHGGYMKIIISCKFLLFFILVLLLSCSCDKCPTDNGNNQYDPRNVSRNDGHSIVPSLTVDNTGNVYIVWADSTPDEWDILFSQKSPEGEWTAFENITNSTERSTSPKIAVDGSGNIHLVWVKGPSFPEDKIYYSMKPMGGSWTEPIQISEGWGAIPSIGIDDAGNVHVIWMDGYYRRKSGGSWGPIETIPSPSHYCRNPAMAVSSGGDVHVVFEPGYDPSEVYYIMKPSGGSWTEPFNVSENNTNSWASDVAVDDDGNAYASWTEMETDQVCFRMRSPTGVWSEKDSIPDIEGDPWITKIETDGETVYFVWSAGIQHYDIYYNTRDTNGFWSNIINLSETSDDALLASIILDPQYNLHIAWQDKTPGNFDIFYTIIQTW